MSAMDFVRYSKHHGVLFGGRTTRQGFPVRVGEQEATNRMYFFNFETKVSRLYILIQWTQIVYTFNNKNFNILFFKLFSHQCTGTSTSQFQSHNSRLIVGFRLF